MGGGDRRKEKTHNSLLLFIHVDVYVFFFLSVYMETKTPPALVGKKMTCCSVRLGPEAEAFYCLGCRVSLLCMDCVNLIPEMWPRIQGYCMPCIIQFSIQRTLQRIEKSPPRLLNSSTATSSSCVATPLCAAKIALFYCECCKQNQCARCHNEQ